jgi:hypothetical protein
MGADPGNAVRPSGAIDHEALVKAVTEQVCKELGL